MFVARMAAVTSLGHSGKCWKIPWGQREAQATLREEEACFSRVLYTLQGATIHTATKARQPETRRSADFSLFRPPMLSHWDGLILPSNTAPGQPSFLSQPPATLHQLFLPALKTRAVNILEHCLCIKQCAWCRTYK